MNTTSINATNISFSAADAGVPEYCIGEAFFFI